MEESIFERMGGTYRQEGGYLLPDLIALKLAPNMNSIRTRAEEIVYAELIYC